MRAVYTCENNKCKESSTVAADCADSKGIYQGTDTTQLEGICRGAELRAAKCV